MTEDHDLIIPTEAEKSRATTIGFPVGKQLMLLGVFLVMIFGIGIVATLPSESTKSTSSSTPATPDFSTVASTTVAVIPALQDIHITAESAFVLDVATQRILYSKKPDEIRPIASITKLMTTLVAHELVTNDTWVRIPQTASVLESTSGLIPGQLLTQQSLQDFAMISSSNDAAHSLATAVGSLINDDQPVSSFVTAMNIRAEELGLPSLAFQNTTGLDTSETEAGAVGTARDVSFLLQYVLTHYPEILEATTLSNARIYTDTGAFYEAENTNQQIASIPQVLGSKTGFTTLAGGNLTIAFDAGYNRPIIITVLGSSFSGRFTDVATLVEAIQANITSVME